MVPQQSKSIKKHISDMSKHLQIHVTKDIRKTSFYEFQIRLMKKEK